MGRRKITIRPISDQKLKHTTFNKRKNGLIKKAAELSMLCDLKLLLIFEDTAGTLIEYSTHNIFNQFEYFNNYMEERIVQFTPKDYPNFFKVNHYKKSKMSEKEFDKESIKNEKVRKQHQQALAIPKHEVEYSDSRQSSVTPKHSTHRSKPMLEQKADSLMSIDTSGSPQLTLDIKKKNTKNLSIAIPDKNKGLESQMNALKRTNIYNNAPPENATAYSRNESSHMKSSHQHQSSPAHQQMIRMPSPQKNSPGLTKSASKSVMTSKKAETPSIFNFNEYLFNPPEPYNPSALKTPDLPSYLETPMTHSMNHMTPGMQHHMAQQFPSPMPPMNPHMVNQFTPQQMSASLMTAHMNMMNGHHMPPMNNGMGGPSSAQSQVPNPHGYYKMPGYMDPLDSPYTKFNFNNRFFYPFVPFSAAPEEGFSPFLKNNMALDIQNNGFNSSKMKKDKSSYFTFKSENPNLMMKSEHPYNEQHMMMTDSASKQQQQQQQDYHNQESTSFMEKPKKKMKV